MNSLPNNYEVLVISVIFCNIEIVAKEMELHMNEIIKDFNENWIIERTNLDYKALYFPKPVSNVDDPTYWKFTMWAPKSIPHITIFMSSLTDGWRSVPYGYSRKFNREFVSIEMSSNIVEYPKYLFDYFDSRERRLIFCEKNDDNDRWEFNQTGYPLGFENKEVYSNKNKKERFNNNLINQYLLALNIDIYLDEFWKSDVLAVNFQRLRWGKRNNY